MSNSEFEAAGLSQLTEKQLQRLNQWLARYTATEASIVKANSKTVKKIQKEETIKARIIGEFNGWDGDTVFKLDNGQVWRQRIKSRHDASMNSPEVVITKNWLGHYRLKIQETGRSVAVERVK